MKASYTLRLPEELRSKVQEEAKRSDMSMNQYIVYTLTKEVSYREAAAALRDRIRKAPSRAEALELLDSIVPDVPPLKDDRIPAQKAK